MRTIHRHFHARSAELLLAAKAGELATPDDELLARLSNHLVVALQDLKKALSEAV